MKSFLKILFTVAVITALISFRANGPEKISVYLIGDSTMAQKQPDKFPETGWGMALQQFFKDNVEIKNHAVNGRSTKSFINEGRWLKVVDELKKGDYVFIQFGHNDEKSQDSSRFVNPYSGYRANLTKFVNEAREKGTIPILLTSVVRRNFNEFGSLIDTHGAYTEVTRSVAHEMNVPLIDMNILTEQLVISYGPEKSKKLYMWVKPGDKNYPDGRQDDTHFNNEGAETVAGLAVQEIKKQNLPLAKFLN